MSHSNTVERVTNAGWDERILVLRNDDLVDTFIIVTERFVVMVDTMINGETAVSLLHHARAHLNNRRLLVINTHADYDHAWGNQIPHAANVPIIGSGRCAAILRSPEAQAELAAMQADEPAIFGGVILTPPTLTFNDALTIDGGDLTLELFPTPGHTPDHIAIYIPEIDTLLAADAAELPFPFARTAEELPTMRASLAKLAAIDAETVLYCHAPVTIGGRLIRDNIAYFDTVETHCRAALARGVPAQPDADADAAALIDLPFATAVPHGPHWQHIHEYYRTTGHNRQIRMMLAWLNQGVRREA
jgi:glyoxylase-like metal-dependent hydrolase (beta-lactamase superfamily II)